MTERLKIRNGAVEPQPNIGQKFNNLFAHFASRVAMWAGHPLTFSVAVLLLIIWAATGPVMDYSTEWQLIVNTGTTICTFLMVFVIQNSQNRDGLAAQIKLDEIIRALDRARNAVINIESLTDEEMAKLHQQFTSLAERARDTDRPAGEAADVAIEQVTAVVTRSKQKKSKS